MNLQQLGLAVAGAILVLAEPAASDSLPPVERDSSAADVTRDARPPSVILPVRSVQPDEQKSESSGNSRIAQEAVEWGLDGVKYAAKRSAPSRGTSQAPAKAPSGQPGTVAAEGEAVVGVTDDAARALHPNSLPGVSHFTDDAARGIGHVGGLADDIGRGAGGAVGLADDAARGVGSAVGFADDAARGIGRLAAFGGAAAAGAGATAVARRKKK